MVVVALICNIFALQKPHGRVQSKENASDLSVSLAGDVMRSSELGPDAHRNIDINMSIDGFSDYRGSI